MIRFRISVISLFVVLGLSELSVADTPGWLPVSRKSVGQSSERVITGTVDSGTVNVSLWEQSSGSDVQRLSPDDVFTGSADQLIRVSCSDADGQCSEGGCMPGIGPNGSGHTPTWVKFTPYVWATQVNGDLTVDGLTAPMNLDLHDLWTMLTNGEVRGGFMGHLGFGRDNWMIFVNGDIVSMDPSAQVRRANLETGMTMTLLELGGGIDLFNANEEDPANSPLRVQALGGIRYYSVDASAILSLPNVNPLIQIENGANWVDLFIGGQAIASISENSSVFLRADIGGFGMGTSSTHAWNVASGFTTAGICGSDLFLGYRVFDVDQTLNGGAGSPLGFGVDQVIHGPVVGLTFQF